MENMPDMSELLRIAQSREGRSFLAMLQSADPAAVNEAAAYMKTGNYEGAQKALSGLLSTPEGKALMNLLGGNYGGTGR